MNQQLIDEMFASEHNNKAPIENQKLELIVKTDEAKDLKLTLKEKFEALIDFLREAMLSLRDKIFEVNVVNQKEIQKVKIVEGVEIQKVEIVNKDKEIQTVEVLNTSDFQKSDKELLDALEPLKYLSDKAEKPVSVRLSDGEKFYKQIENAVKTSGLNIRSTIASIKDDASFGIATTKITPIGALCDETSTDSVDEGDAGIPRMSADRVLYIKSYPYSTIVDGRKTVTTAGTAEALVASSTVCKKVVISALEGNTDAIVVGSSTVVAAAGTRRGLPLTPLSSVTIEIDDVNKIYIDSVVSGEGVSFVYYT